MKKILLLLILTLSLFSISSFSVYAETEHPLDRPQYEWIQDCWVEGKFIGNSSYDYTFGDRTYYWTFCVPFEEDIFTTTGTLPEEPYIFHRRYTSHWELVLDGTKAQKNFIYPYPTVDVIGNPYYPGGNESKYQIGVEFQEIEGVLTRINYFSDESTTTSTTALTPGNRWNIYGYTLYGAIPVLDLPLHYIQKDEYVYVSYVPFTELTQVFDSELGIWKFKEVSSNYFADRYEINIYHKYNIDYSFGGLNETVSFEAYHFLENEYRTLTYVDHEFQINYDSNDLVLLHNLSDDRLIDFEDGWFSWRFLGTLPIEEEPIDEEPEPVLKWWETIFNFTDYNPIDYLLSGLATVTVGVAIAAVIVTFKKSR